VLYDYSTLFCVCQYLFENIFKFIFRKIRRFPFFERQLSLFDVKNRRKYEYHTFCGSVF